MNFSKKENVESLDGSNISYAPWKLGLATPSLPSTQQGVNRAAMFICLLKPSDEHTYSFRKLEITYIWTLFPKTEYGLECQTLEWPGFRVVGHARSLVGHLLECKSVLDHMPPVILKRVYFSKAYVIHWKLGYENQEKLSTFSVKLGNATLS